MILSMLSACAASPNASLLRTCHARSDSPTCLAVVPPGSSTILENIVPVLGVGYLIFVYHHAALNLFELHPTLLDITKPSF